VALEAEVTLIDGCNVVQINIDNSTPTFDRANSVACTIAEHADGTGGVSQWTLQYMNRIEITIENIIKIPKVYKLFRMTCDKKRESSTKLMDWFAHIALANLRKSCILNLPKLNHAVPTTRNKEALSIVLEAEHVLNW